MAHYWTCAHGANHDNGERCDCRPPAAPQVAQTGLEDSEKVRGRIGAFLTQLRRRPGDLAPHVTEYFKLGGSLKAAPPDVLHRIEADLAEEVKVRKKLGDAAYFASRAVAEKIEVMEFALALLKSELLADGRKEGDVLTWAEFDRLRKRRFAAHCQEWADIPEPVLAAGGESEVPA